MSDIQTLIKMLQSENPNKRYDACEELRVSPHPLPREATDALNVATNDANADVADAARRALSLHTLMDDEKEQKQVLNNPITNAVKNWLPIGLLAGLIPGLIIFFLGIDAPTRGLYTICIGSTGIVCGIIGASIEKRNKTTVWIAAILSSILGAGLLFMLLIFSCAFCM